MDNSDYINGYIQKSAEGFTGVLRIEGIDMSPVVGTYFKCDADMCLWLRRAPLIRYDMESGEYVKKPREPRWEVYMRRRSVSMGSDVVAYEGTFVFLHFKYRIKGVWDAVFGKDRNRLNLFVERLPMDEQTIINGIRERNIKK